MKLHRIELLQAKPQQGAINDGLHVTAVDGGQVSQIRDELGEDLNASGVFGVMAAKVPDQLLDAGVDVGAIERGDAGLDEGSHVVLRGDRVNGAVAAGQVPATFDDAGDFKAVCQGDARHHQAVLSLRGRAV